MSLGAAQTSIKLDPARAAGLSFPLAAERPDEAKSSISSSRWNASRRPNRARIVNVCLFQIVVLPERTEFFGNMLKKKILPAAALALNNAGTVIATRQAVFQLGFPRGSFFRARDVSPFVKHWRGPIVYRSAPSDFE